MHGTTYGDGYLTAEQFAGFAQGNITGAYNVSSLPVEKDETDGLYKFKKGTSLLVVRKYLEEMQAHGINCPLLLRYPLTLYYYAVAFEGASFTDSLPLDYDPEEHKTDLGYRLGMYNDGYLGSYSDYGTFTLKKSSSLTSGMPDGWEKDRIRSRRSEEVAVLEKYLRHTAYGGELLAGESDTKPAFWDKVPDEACEEMKLVHLSYLNISHNYHAFEALDTSSYTYGGQNLFHYLLSHMGYRYIITNLDQQPVSAHGKNIHINLGIVNDGVTEMPFHRVKGFKVYLIPAGQNQSSSATAFSAEGEFKGDYSKQDVSEIERYVSTSVEAFSLSAGDYDVYLKVCDITGNSLTDGKYAIRFANEGIWNETLSANKLGTVTIE